jgi:hypothetical protein
MSCSSCQIPYDFNTDHPSVPSCDRNNCRCGSSKNCMYYNDGVKSHYNYVAVQGTGSIENPQYSCANKAYDYLNDNNMYGDHALGGLGAYGTEDGEQYGTVDYNDHACSEYGIGQRDMCDTCDLDQPNFYGDESGCSAITPGHPLYQDVDVSLRLGQYGLGMEIQRWLLWLGIMALLWFMNKRGLLPKFLKDILNTKVMGYTLLALSAYLLVGYLLLSFFF